MATIRAGSSIVKALRVGTQVATKMYIGATLLWPPAVSGFTGLMDGLSAFSGNVRRKRRMPGLMDGLSIFTDVNGMRRKRSFTGLSASLSGFDSILVKFNKLTGLSGGISAFSGTYKLTRPLNGLSTSLSGLDALLSKAGQKPLTGLMTGVSDTVISLKAKRKVTGLSASISGMSAPSYWKRKLTGTNASLSAFSGVKFLKARKLTASDTTISSFSGNLSASGHPTGITLVGTPTTGQAINGGNITLSLPSGLQQNDVVYVGFAISFSGGGGTSSSGWTQVGINKNVGTGIHTQMFRKVMGAVPDTSIVLTGNASANDSASAIAIAFRGVNTTTPEDVTITTASAASGSPDCPSITPVTNGAISIAYAATGILDTTGTGAPAGYTNFTQIGSNDNTDTTSYMSWKSGLTGGVAENPAIYSGVTTNSWCAYTVAVRPA